MSPENYENWVIKGVRLPHRHRRQAKNRYFFFSNDLRGLTRRRIKVFWSSMSHSIVSPFSIVVASAMTAGKFT